MAHPTHVLMHLDRLTHNMRLLHERCARLFRPSEVAQGDGVDVTEARRVGGLLDRGGQRFHRVRQMRSDDVEPLDLQEIIEGGR